MGKSSTSYASPRKLLNLNTKMEVLEALVNLNLHLIVKLLLVIKSQKANGFNLVKI